MGKLELMGIGKTVLHRHLRKDGQEKENKCRISYCLEFPFLPGRTRSLLRDNEVRFTEDDHPNL